MPFEVKKFKTPFIPLDISLEQGLSILQSESSEIERFEDESEDFYKISIDDWQCGFYVKNGKIQSSWYDDPLGRDSEDGINEKVTSYLSRYGNIENWESGVNNGWIQFFINKECNINMAYGLHKDVIRFNKIYS